MSDKKSLVPMEHHNIGGFLKEQSSKILTSISDEDKTAFVLKMANHWLLSYPMNDTQGF